jgi:pimeloyl-ACP methyl ester carboxylesterase
MKRALLPIWAAAALLGACAQAPLPSSEAAPVATACPAELQPIARCLAGQDSAGAYYLIAMPSTWNGHLVLHAHGGPALGAPKPERSVDDLQRWAIMVKSGYAWAGSTFRQGGVAVRAAAEDTERLRRIFIQHVAAPKRTILHGQSWGAGVAAVGAEMFTRIENGRPPYDAVLLSSGVLAGGTQAYNFRLDLRVVYQFLCNNHPKPDEPAYPLWMGLPPGAALTQAQLAQRVNECLSLNKPAAQRSADQQRKVKTLVEVIRIPEKSILGHLNWATWHFQDIVQRRTGGLNPFGNAGVHYAGSDDDAALNAGVLRYQADPQAVARFGADTDPQGRIPVPVLTVHGVKDATAFVEMDHSFRQILQGAGTADHLVQTFTDDSEHSYLSDPVYPALMSALLRWVDAGVKPSKAGLAQACRDCRFLPDFEPAALQTRVPAR